jgi:hypothetical protein
MRKIVFLSFLIYSALALGGIARGATVDDLLVAIHKVESNGRVGPILGDQGRALGPLQIHRIYWADADLGLGKYEDCKDLGYSRCVVLAYFLRYEPDAVKNNDVEALARLHNSGPAWRSKTQKTDDYWRRISACLSKMN